MEEKKINIKNVYIKRLIRRIIIFLSYITLTNKVEKFLIKSQAYNEMYFSCHSLHMRLARLYFMKKHYSMNYIMYDEGVGSYVGQFKQKSKINRLLENIITGGVSDKMKIKRLLYQPELDYKYEQEKGQIGKIAPIGDIDRVNKGIYEYVFDYKIPELKQIKCIFFDGIREDQFKSKKALDEMQNLYQVIEDAVGAENMIVKTHPRAINKYHHKCAEFPTSSCPFEINLLELSLDNIVLVSISSSSVVTPKILFDSEPCVILLSDISQRYFKTPQNLKYFFKRVGNIYKNKNNFCIPNSVVEMKTQIKNHL